MRHLFLGTLTLLCLYFTFIHDRHGGADIIPRLQALEAKSPKLVLLGNSMLRAGVDEERLSEHLGCTAFKAYCNGSASAWWYLYVKNVIGKMEQPPRALVLLFRDHFLTDPSFRTTGPYAMPIRTLSEPSEPLLTALLGQEFGYSPLVWASQEAKERWETRIMKTTAKLARVPKATQYKAVAAVFDEKRMQAELLTQQQLSSESTRGLAVYDFDSQVSSSFLPHLLAELKKLEIHAIFVRVKRRRELSPDSKSLELQGYMQALTNYLSQEGAYLIDFSDEICIGEEHYGPGDHLNEEGQRLFTTLLAEKLDSVVTR